MKYALPVVCICLLALSACATTSTAVYQSNAPEVRGERAISSNIELVKEVELEGSILGVFYSREVYASGDAQLVLFTLRPPSGGFGVKSGQGTMDLYDLGNPSSLSV
ncbi:MAG TPA: hypothetical protein VFH83_07510, partial [Spirochaetia bacterium]|nr:hypothetical protein [Spirochaetia bacterium]